MRAYKKKKEKSSNIYVSVSLRLDFDPLWCCITMAVVMSLSWLTLWYWYLVVLYEEWLFRKGWSLTFLYQLTAVTHFWRPFHIHSSRRTIMHLHMVCKIKHDNDVFFTTAASPFLFFCLNAQAKCRYAWFFTINYQYKMLTERNL